MNIKKLEIRIDDFAPQNTNETLEVFYDPAHELVKYRLQSCNGHGYENPIDPLDLLQPWLDAYQLVDQAAGVLTRVRVWLSTVMHTEDETNYEEARDLDRMESIRHEGSAV